MAARLCQGCAHPRASTFASCASASAFPELRSGARELLDIQVLATPVVAPRIIIFRVVTYVRKARSKAVMIASIMRRCHVQLSDTRPFMSIGTPHPLISTGREDFHFRENMARIGIYERVLTSGARRPRLGVGVVVVHDGGWNASKVVKVNTKDNRTSGPQE
ncbi:hypothetical protein BC826DRAFT_567618 [Russula brevipes]|nr:hypothetical protein BC826DRAFT_567618 [Russula brevipes]